MTLAAEIVDAINVLAGSHEGHRPVHAKGTLLTGSFTGTPRARRSPEPSTSRASQCA